MSVSRDHEGGFDRQKVRGHCTLASERNYGVERSNDDRGENSMLHVAQSLSRLARFAYCACHVECVTDSPRGRKLRLLRSGDSQDSRGDLQVRAEAVTFQPPLTAAHTSFAAQGLALITDSMVKEGMDAFDLSRKRSSNRSRRIVKTSKNPMGLCSSAFFVLAVAAGFFFICCSRAISTELPTLAMDRLAQLSIEQLQYVVVST
jgi:hypothetical protein